MKPLSVRQIRQILSGTLIQGSDQTIVHYGAYRLKQVRKKNTILFTEGRIVSWDKLKKFFPLVVVTHMDYSKNEQLENLTIIKVKDTGKAYWEFVKYYRSQFQIPIVAITGTSGKSTTKEMIKHILSAAKNITSTVNSSNSRTAHLQYLLGIDDSTEAAVFETAVGAPGDILRAGEYYKPTIGIITNIGAHHLNYCKTPEAYIQAKGEIVDIIDPSGVLIINSEDENTRKINMKSFSGKIIEVGKSTACHYKAENIKYDKNGMQFNLRYKQEHYPVFVPGFGEHQVYNALAAIAAANELGINPARSAERLRSFKKFNKQLQVFEGINGSTILDDTWSMTSTSLEAGLKVLSEIGKGKKKIAVLGGMTDLGAWGYIIHEKTGEMIARQDVDVLITIGELARIMGEHAVKSGSNAKLYSFNNSILVVNLIKKMLDKNTIVLIKGDMYIKEVYELAIKLRAKT
ncbi:UDP-N-acetylmuramoyl-tripeptide--D-alanyl-D-alanine ligase [Bacillus sp. S/N-304-OC-R1]|uniref:UDP-N-acetylmuramoyl-tripeptide--D-alanyl-D- alanine ligase n=1 Tax=Bacillus sp. S/N-304-OC-R1 TaxID=2758034 RepID=UPI001C8EFF48|nr:UDP-N-acetylmuramoyl-tripeptide--D-alanyl-D-alanine ligase [Bacillus sp. S/N-304-OC-R1]MBY0121274.1 UDP-N-acetylmuramoyl-tripeptide--D-alanyl-D-alanine ligase [Bacillus sp. S/N-304-OC-R1]